MTNELLWIVLLVLNFCLVIVAYRLFGTVGLVAWIALAAVTANIQVVKTIELFGLTATLGNVVYAGSFLATDILSERHGKRAAVRAVWIGFFAVGSFVALMTLALVFEPAGIDGSQGALQTVFGYLPRIIGASLVAYLASQRLDVWLYGIIRRRAPWWIANNASTALSQLADSLMFTFGAFVGVFPAGVLLEILLTTYVLKFVVAIADTPFLYLATRLRPGIGPLVAPGEQHAAE